MKPNWSGPQAGQQAAFVAHGAQEGPRIATAPFRGLQHRFQHRCEFIDRRSGPSILAVQPQGHRLQRTPPEFRRYAHGQLLALAPALEQHLDAFIVELLSPPRQAAAVAVHQAQIGQQQRIARHLGHPRRAEIGLAQPVDQFLGTASAQNLALLP
jgi:hypothetical protein